MKDESYSEFLARVKRQKALPLLTQQGQPQTESLTTGKGVTIPNEILWETELYKAKRTLEHLESRKQRQSPETADEFDENDYGIYNSSPLSVQFFPDAELNDDFDFIETAETIGNESDAFEDIEDIDETDFY